MGWPSCWGVLGGCPPAWIPLVMSDRCRYAPILHGGAVHQMGQRRTLNQRVMGWPCCGCWMAFLLVLSLVAVHLHGYRWWCRIVVGIHPSCMALLSIRWGPMANPEPASDRVALLGCWMAFLLVLSLVAVHLHGYRWWCRIVVGVHPSCMALLSIR